MSLSGISTPVRASGRSRDQIHYEWTYTDTSGTTSLDTTQSDQFQGITTPLTRPGTGRTQVQFPKSKRAWVEGCFVEPVTIATAANNVRGVVCLVNPTAGTLEVRFVAANGGSAPIDPPESGTRVRLTISVERP